MKPNETKLINCIILYNFSKRIILKEAEEYDSIFPYIYIYIYIYGKIKLSSPRV